MRILKNFISPDELETRWGLDKNGLHDFIYDCGYKNAKLAAWRVKEFRKAPDGTTSAFVARAQSLYASGCIFDLDEVRALEVVYPELVASKIETCSQEAAGVSRPPVPQQEGEPVGGPARTGAASVASQEKTLAAWKAVIPAMCAVYHKYLAEGPRTRTRNEIERDFTKLEAKLSKAQLDFFRSFLPEGHVNKNGGATVQKS